MNSMSQISQEEKIKVEGRKENNENNKFKNIIFRPSLIYSMTFGLKVDQFHQLKNKYEEKEKLSEEKQQKSDELQNALKKAEAIRQMDFHKVDFITLVDNLESDINCGLNDNQIQEKILKYGQNALKEKQPLPTIVLWLYEMTGVFPIMLWIGAAMCFIAYGVSSSDPSNLFIASVLCFINLISGSFAFYQNGKSTAVMAQFKKFLPPKAKALRNSKWVLLNASDILPGDIVEISMGESIPADVRLFEVSNMKADQSSLTGESDEISKKDKPTHDNVLETANVAFFGTKCTFGKGKGIVVNTGERTIIGQIANLAQTAESGETTLSRDMAKFVKIIAYIAFPKGIIFFIIGIILGISWIESFTYAVGIITANVPEGLVVTVTISLTKAAINLAKKKVLVKNLETIETLGSTTCICSDKTGTLTQAKMSVSHIWISNQTYDCSINFQVFQENVNKVNNKDINAPKYSMSDKNFSRMIEYIALSTTAEFDEQPNENDIINEISSLLQKPKKRFN